MNHRYKIQLRINNGRKNPLKTEKYEHKRRRRVDEQVEHDTKISKESHQDRFGKFKRT